MLLPFLTIFLISASFLSYEILLMRLLSILNWSHYAYMVISLAMLGLGFSGVILVLFSKLFNKLKDKIILMGCFLFSLTIPFAFYLNQKLPLNYLYLVWDWHQFIYLGINYFIYGFPFLIVSTIIAVFFLKYPQRTSWVYAANLLGSGCGILTSVLIMYFVSPEKYLAVPGILAALSGLFWGGHYLTKFKKFCVIILFLIFTLSHFCFSPQSLITNISEYKGLPQLLRLPSTKIISRDYSPLGLIHILEGKSIRLFTGLSINFKGELPHQKALTIDADSPSAIVTSSTNLQFLDETIYSAPYYLAKNPHVLIIGGSANNEILLAQCHKSNSITVVEMNPQIISVIKKTLGTLFYDLYQQPNVEIAIKEARGYLKETQKKFNIICIPPMGGFSASASGVYAQDENYLHTLEAYQLFYHKLYPQGILITSQWAKIPARDGIKLFATGFSALKKLNVSNPKEHLAMIRNWDVITLLIKNTPFTQEEIGTLKGFCSKRNFDISYLPGINLNETNRFNKLLPDDIYFKSAQDIISLQKQNAFFASYPFQIKPATDDKPYFSNFFRWKALPHLIKTLGREWLPFAEYGYLALLTTFIQAVIIGGLIIILPLKLLKKTAKISFNPRVWLYFSILGFSYMLLEMAFIQKFILFLPHPIYSTSVIIASFLLISGMGSLLSKKILQKNKKYQLLPFLIIILLGIIYTFTLDYFFSVLSGINILLRLVISFLITAPLALCMGIPFPFGIQKIIISGGQNFAKAWAYNGFFSVLGTVSAPILTNLLGFKIVSLIGCFGYGFSLLLWIKKFNTG